MIDREHPSLSIARQTELLALSRSSVYYRPVVNEEEIRIMHAVDQIFTDCPFYGSRRIRYELKERFGIRVNRKRVQRLMRLIGLEAIYPKRRTTTADKQHIKYPYLLRGLPVIRPNQVWGADITYVQLERGFCYLAAHLDWFSRYVLSWELSPSLDTSFCTASLNRALNTSIPEIHNSDQGVQYTSEEYTDILNARDIKISMDGRGRCMDNIFTERLWRTVKYENVFLKSYRNLEDAQIGLAEYFQFYNHRRPHQSLGYRTPAKIYGTKH